MRSTVKDVALRAGVSPKTVSNVINGTAFVRPETRARVEEALAELDYVPNLGARGLRNGRYGLIALALPDLSTAYSAEVAHHFVEEGHARGWSVQIEETAAEPHREQALLSRARSHLVDGLVLNPVSLAESVVDEHVARGPLPPTVLIGEVEQDRTDQVGVDSVAGARDMTEHLLATGVRRIAVVGVPGDAETAAARQRTEGYRQALAAAGVAHDPVLEIATPRWTADEARDAVRAFLDEHPPPEAFFCFTDSMALAVVHVLWERGLRVPDDVAVAGFDDVEPSRYAVPPLTTVSFDLRAFAATALDLLRDRIDDPHRAPRRLTVPHRVVVRASTTRS
ncbi:LacI family transcriptional regulator [Cellulomonas sp. H30R-01]|uniref:LacI family transcriptional regulator n=1 Tax=Cellulomonas algicola TaxID=2071633 RepID=A0A401V1S5_9CELL|nr:MULTISPECIES: LacI family DNA-binding transcriptional regulator [Cellulomonas]QHT56992.1 LacI family transcriptional regulator [Cellulomonas sp. H30R-01]GCD20852.1 LacI family transcriptional regulator [Cellulomonas algicola]